MPQPGPPPAGTDLRTGLAIYLKLDDGPGRVTALDSSGNDNTGSLQLLDAQRAWVAGRFGTGLDIAGQGWVSIPESPSLNSISEGFGFSAFIKRTGNGTILARRAVGANGFLYRFFVVDGRLGLQINSSNGARVNLVSARTLPAGAWVHVAATYDLQRARIYLEGIEIGSEIYGLNIGPENSPLNVGASQTAALIDADDRFAGEIDELTVFSRALSEPDVRALAGGFVPPVP
jgi:large repetitive protein